MTIFDRLSQYGVVPVIAIDDASQAVAMADALIAGGLPVAEVTFRTDAAGAAIAAISNERPDVEIGAGTVLTEGQLDAAQAAGARFCLSPGLDADLLVHAKQVGMPFAPGVMTPTDLQAALKAGCEMVKFFPGGPAGGPNMLKNISAPYAHTGIGFNPTGGVNMANLPEWLALPNVRAVGGTWIATRDDIAAGNWAKITENAAAAVALVAEIRSNS